MTERNEHLDEGTIHAWLDGALAPDESARVEAHAGGCAACASLVAEARGLIAASSRILSSLDAVPAGVIPGSDAGVDQLAALRARRRATSRRWWHDPRFVAAASLLFVAGVGSAIWRVIGNQSLSVPISPVVQESTLVIESANQVSDAVRESAAAVAAAAPPVREMKAAARPSPADSSFVVITGVSADTSAERKVDVTRAPLRAPAAIAANESRRTDSTMATDLIGAAGRAERSRRADSLTDQRAAMPPRLAVEAARSDSIRAAASGVDLARRSLFEAKAVGAGFRMADVTRGGDACYQLRPASTAGRPMAAADSVRLLDEVDPGSSDPPWRLARPVGDSASPVVMRWREIDSITVELQRRGPADTTVVRFRTIGSVPSTQIPGVRIAIARRISCP